MAVWESVSHSDPTVPIAVNSDCLDGAADELPSSCKPDDHYAPLMSINVSMCCVFAIPNGPAMNL